MNNLQKVTTVSNFILETGDEKLRTELQKAHKALRESLNLPDNIRLAGLTFEYSDQPVQLDCEKTCTKIIDNQVYYFCCH